MLTIRTQLAALWVLLAGFSFISCSTGKESAAPQGGAVTEEFTVLVYNVENLFDVDGVALFEDYKQVDTNNPQPYGPRKLLTKLENIVVTLKAINGGDGPEVILFNEFEYDRTPADTPIEYEAFLDQYSETTVKAMLTRGFDEVIADLPVDALLLKLIVDSGMPGYEVIIQAPRPIDETVPAHTNSIFSRYPILDHRTHTAEFGRDILEATIDVKGHPVILFCNHWKSGASRIEEEPKRIESAKVLKQRLDQILAEDTLADVIIGGDLNCHYNQTAVLEIESGVNNILNSQGDELAIRDEDVLYNLWMELPPEQRYSEIYRGIWGTLMQILLPRGAYHRSGITYVDQSFGQVILPGQNVGEALGRPIDWSFAGETGSGFSDHLAVYARFQVNEKQDGYVALRNPSRERVHTAFQPSVDFNDLVRFRTPESAQSLLRKDMGTRARDHYGEVFEVKGQLISNDPLLVQLGDEIFGIWSPQETVFLNLREREPETPIHFLGEFSEHRGYQQFVILLPEWLKE